MISMRASGYCTMRTVSTFRDAIARRPETWRAAQTKTTSKMRRAPSCCRYATAAARVQQYQEVERRTHFGFQTVTPQEKTRRVGGVFSSVAEQYDKMNDVMSLGWHRVWKDYFVRGLNPGFSPLFENPRRSQTILDMAGGTGDIAFRMISKAHVKNGNPDVRVMVSDINVSMLAVGKQRSATLPPSQQAGLCFVEANAEDLTWTKPLLAPEGIPAMGIPSNSVDLYTVSFGIRNFSNMAAALREAYRVLKPGGVFACLEFSKANKWSPVFEAIYKRWSFGAIPLIGQLVAGDRDSYQYLVESIERFPGQEEFRQMIIEAGFVVPGQGYEDLTGGIAAIHKGIKPSDAAANG